MKNIFDVHANNTEVKRERSISVISERGKIKRKIYKDNIMEETKKGYKQTYARYEKYTKYTGLSEEERKRKYLDDIKEWKKRTGNGRQYGYLHGHCEECGADYANIYEHKKTKKHAKNAEIKGKEEKIC